MTDFLDQLDSSYGSRSYVGTTPTTHGGGGGKALDTFFTSLKTRRQKPLVDYNRVTALEGGPKPYNPFAPTGRVAQVSPVAAYQPAGPPERYNVNLLGEGISTVAESAIGGAFLGTPGGQRGGVTSVNVGPGSFGLANAPVNFQNFATYAREAPLSLITGLMGHKYQQPDPNDPNAPPQGPVNHDDPLANISQGDFGGLLDNVIDGVAAFGKGVADVAQFPVDRYREANAIDRGKSIRDLVTTGATPGTLIARISSAFDQSRFDWSAIAKMAEARGLKPLDLAAELWDLNPAIVQQIAAKPDMTDQQLEDLVKHEPFSYDPGVNVATELVANIAPLVLGGGLIRGSGFIATGILGAAGYAETAATAAGVGRPIAAALNAWDSIRAAGLVGRPIATAARLGAWSLPKAWRGVQLLESANRASLVAGTTIRFGEWALKQAFEVGGNEEGVKMMDEWLWEMPLSTNPGLMLLDAFAVHPMRTAKAIVRGSKDVVTLKLMGGEDLAVSPIAAEKLGSIADMPLDVAQARLFDKLGWDGPTVVRLFGEDGPMSKTDLYNGLLYVAAQVVRAKHETRLRFLEPTADVVSRNAAFWRTYGDEAVGLLQSALTGRGKDANKIVEAITKEFWERKNLIDASELGNEGFIGPYDGHVALHSLASWVRASGKVREYDVNGQVLKLREDVNTAFVQAYRERLGTMKPTETVPVRMLNELRLGVPGIIRFSRSLQRRGERGAKLNVRQVSRILDAAEAEQGVADLTSARPRTEGVPALRPEEAQAPMEIAKAFGLRQETVDKLLAATTPEDLAGPIPNDLAKVLNSVFRMNEAEQRRRLDAAWSRVHEWWQRMYPSAVERGQAISDVDRFAKIVQDRYAGTAEGGVDAAAFRRITETISHPYRAEEKIGTTADAIAEERNVALTSWLDAMSGWLDAPERGLRVVTGPDGRQFVEREGFLAQDAVLIDRLATRAAQLELTPESLAILADPLAHPLEKVGPIREALSEHPEFTLTDAESSRLRMMGDLEGTYASAVKEVLGEDTLTNRDSVQKLTDKAVASAESVDQLREQARSLSQLIDRSPTKQLTGEYHDFLDRAMDLGSTKNRGTEFPNWRAVPLTATGVRRANVELALANARTAATARLERATTRLAAAEADLKRASTLTGKFDPGDVTVAADPLAKFPTRKAATAAAKESSRVEGKIMVVKKAGSRWGVFDGEYTPQARPVAPETAAAPAEPAPAPAAPPEPSQVATGDASGPPAVRGDVGSVMHRLAVDAPTEGDRLTREVMWNEGRWKWLYGTANAERTDRPAGMTPTAPGPKPAWVPDDVAAQLLDLERTRLAVIQDAPATKLKPTAKDLAALEAHRARVHAAEAPINDILIDLVKRGQEPGPPPPIVEQIGEAQRIREAQVEALQRQAQANEVARGEATAAYQQNRLSSAGATGYDHIVEELNQLAPDDQAGYDALVEKYGLENVSAADNWRERRPLGTGNVTFLDPADNKTPIPAKVILVDAGALLTSDRPGFPPDLQPRARGVRSSSNEQIVEYARDLQPGKLFGTTDGSTGMPVVMPDGAVLAGNGRTMAIRLASTAEYGKYRAALEAEAGKHGFSPELVASMDRPMLVRELGDVAPDVAARLAWQLNEMPVGDLAPSVAAALRPSDIRAFSVGDEQSLADAIRAPSNTPAVAKMIGRLPRDWHARYFDPATGLNEPGAKLLEAALLSKILRADDRAAPGFEAARSVVFQVAEQGGEDIRRISGGLAEGAAQIVKAYELADSGAITPDILTLGDDLAPALARIIELRNTGLNMEGVRRSLDNATAFDQFTLTPTQTHLAKLLAASTTQREVRTFLRAVAKAAEEGPVAGQEAMFADVAQVDYTGLLNEGVKAWNALRTDGQSDYFASTEAPYDVPLGTGVSENALGATEGPARMTQPLAPEEVDAEVASRVAGADVTFEPETVDLAKGAPAGAVIRPSDPLEAKLYEALSADWEGVHREYADIFDTLDKMSPEVQQDTFQALLDSANDGSIRPAEWMALRLMAGNGGMRVNRAGRYNMKWRQAPLEPDMAALGLQHLRDRPLADSVPYADQIAPLPADATPEQIATRERDLAQIESLRLKKPKATVIKPQEQQPITAEELAADVGPDVPHAPSSDRVDTAIASTEHTVLVGDNPTLNRAIRKAVDAPVVEDLQRRLYEVHAPDARAIAESVDARRQQAQADMEAAQAELDAVGAQEQQAAGPDAPTVESVFPDAETRDQWDRLMRSGVDQIASAVGSSEPVTMGELADAVESIDRGVYADPVTGVGLTSEEAMQLRTHLMRLMNGELESALTRSGKARASRYTKATARPPDPFDAEKLQDRAKLIMDDLDKVVKVDPNLPVIEGFLGAQYVLSAAPKLAKDTGGRLSPRLLLNDHFAEDVLPGLTAELEVGRMEDWPRRVGNSHGARLIDHIFGPRPEKEIRAQAVQNFKAGIDRYVDGALHDAGDLKRIDKVVDGAFNLWRERQESIKIGPYQQYRRISLMGPEVLNALFDKAIEAEYPGGRPSWLSDIYAAGQSPAKLWRRADNRVRNYIAESGMPLSSSLEKVYGKAADLGESPGRNLTVVYHVARFLMDIRWVGLEAIEPMMIALPRGGVGPVLEASVLRKSGKLQSAGRKVGLVRTGDPLAFGIDRQKVAMREYAHWAASGDLEQGTGVRWRYLIAELAREQRKPFRDTVKTMMREEPGLRRIIEESDNGNVDAFLARTERDWQLAEQGTKEFKTTQDAAAFFKRWLDDGVIDDQTYGEFVNAKRYTQHPAIEAELQKSLGDPVTAAVMDRLAAINQGLFHDLTSAFFGQDNRSNLQRAANHPFLFWPISYQIKATKWLLKLMLDEFGGVDTGASVGGAFQKVYDEHRRRWVADPQYRARFAENKTLYFLAGMIFPIIPTELGVSLSPYTRLTLNSEYDRPFGAFGVGPIYTNLALLPRLIAEQSKPGQLFGDPSLAPAVDKAKQLFPQSISVSSRKKPGTSQLAAEDQAAIQPGSVDIPYVEPIDRANP